MARGTLTKVTTAQRSTKPLQIETDLVWLSVLASSWRPSGVHKPRSDYPLERFMIAATLKLARESRRVTRSSLNRSP